MQSESERERERVRESQVYIDNLPASCCQAYPSIPASNDRDSYEPWSYIVGQRVSERRLYVGTPLHILLE